jgi:hypothetical protein
MVYVLFAVTHLREGVQLTNAYMWIMITLLVRLGVYYARTAIPLSDFLVRTCQGLRPPSGILNLMDLKMKRYLRTKIVLNPIGET